MLGTGGQTMQQRLIDANALDFEKLQDTNGKAIPANEYIAFLKGAIAAEEMIKNAPTIDAEPVVHAHWIDKCVRDWHCSNYDGTIQKVRIVDGYCNEDLPKFCPDCGAKMDEEQE